jgi:preprotein translocase subunit SecE
LSTQDTTAPKRRSSAANRRRKRQADIRQGQALASQPTSVDRLEHASSSVVTEESMRLKPAEDSRKESRADRKASARESAEPRDGSELQKEKHLRRKEERREAKSRKPEREGRRQFVNTERFGGLQRFYEEAASEIRKVQWPDRETTRNLVIVVIALSVVLGVLLGGIDYVLFQLFEALT